MRPLIASYRLQLRQGVDFGRAAQLLPYIADLGVSHLYLSPIFTAQSGSTHGYDVANPAEIDPVLGGRSGYERLVTAAQAHGLDIVLDLVPNHTVLSTENPWLVDALTHGAESRFAKYFDVDWAEGLILPLLPQPKDEMLQQGAFKIDTGGQRITWEGGWLPLAPGSAESGDPAEVLQRQHWHLRHWVRERKRLTHRRFFNITSLIGMRIELPEVFEAMSALPLSLLREGLAHGLRIDHVDGLADPAEYLRRLRQEVGPKLPIWIEKILTGEERLRHWPVTGTTGYEANDRITRLLLDAEGMDRLDRMWRGATGAKGDYAAACRAARHQILSEDLAAELSELTRIALQALNETDAEEDAALVKPEQIKEALRALLVAFPRYRSYIDSDGPSAEDLQLLTQTAEEAAATLPDRQMLDRLHARLAAPKGPAGRAFVRRFQQVTGAVVAKAQEDTAFYRHTRCLAEAEVGSEPDAPPLTPAEFEDYCTERACLWPQALTLGSSHDTKRGEDARARLIALTHLPEEAAVLWAQAARLKGPNTPGGSVLWYILQSAIALWDPDRADLEDRLEEHLEKALREAKELTDWHDPDEDAEAQAADFGRALLAQWRADPPEALRKLVSMGEGLSLTQLALRVFMPGVPDIYQGSEKGSFDLTDPDNRTPLDPAAPISVFGWRKTALLKELVALRRADPELFTKGSTRLTPEAEGLALTRSLGGRAQRLLFSAEGAFDPQFRCACSAKTSAAQ